MDSVELELHRNLIKLGAWLPFDQRRKYQQALRVLLSNMTDVK
jgi:hypothetical protein